MKVQLQADVAGYRSPRGSAIKGKYHRFNLWERFRRPFASHVPLCLSITMWVLLSFCGHPARVRQAGSWCLADAVVSWVGLGSCSWPPIRHRSCVLLYLITISVTLRCARLSAIDRVCYCYCYTQRYTSMRTSVHTSPRCFGWRRRRPSCGKAHGESYAGVELQPDTAASHIHRTR